MIYLDGADAVRRGRPPMAAHAKTKRDFRKEGRAKKREQRLEQIAILDFETDPFDNTKPTDEIHPFLCVLYSDSFEPIIIWDDDNETFIRRVCVAIEKLPNAFTIYAHNGGKFDYMFLLRRLRGTVKFKGRGLMSCHIGRHELRDSFHIIPERLANWQKDLFDYSKLQRRRRKDFRNEIIQYCINDCRYLLDIVKTFVQNHGFKISIGQAAIAQLRKSYNVKRIGEQKDAELRQYFFGGRVECLAGKGHFAGPYKLYDVNSMYPAVMANLRHPIGCEYAPRRGTPSDFTAFVKLRARNFGAFVSRGANGQTSTELPRGDFFVSKHEFDMAVKLGLIEDIEIDYCIDCDEFSTFDKFVLPLYENRLQTKALLKSLTKGSAAYNDAKKDDIFYKLLLNNCYGKFAQNPRRFHESYITDCGERPPHGRGETHWDALPKYENNDYALWERPSLPWRFFNVGTGASITGAARAVLMEAIENADDPIYCDTDSLICRNLRNTIIDPIKLGAWDIEAEYSEVLIAGKKLYATRDAKLSAGQLDAVKVRSKGVAFLNGDKLRDPTDRLQEQERVWSEMHRLLVDDVLPIVSRGVTLTKSNTQYYLTRRVRATAPVYIIPRYHERRKLANGRHA